jgi:uncharacterized protein (TIGR02594 family)
MSVSEPHWLQIARDLIGLREIKGAQHSAEILRLWKDAGLPFTDDETAWCAGFVGGVLARAGIAPSLSAAARSYATWGVNVLDLGTEDIPLGAVVVYARPPSEWSGHVGFAVGLTKDGHIMTLGGNQRDSVNIAPFHAARLVAARWPYEDRSDIRMLRPIPRMTTSLDLSTGET